MTKQFTKLLLLAVGLFASTLAFAQVKVSGTVTGSDGEPLPGASIIIKGAQSGTVADFDGSYELGNVPRGSTLTYSFLGFLSKDIEVGNETTINVVLQENAAALDEVVVVGYGTQSREGLTTSISSVSSEDLTAIPVSSVEEALEGRAAGVQVRSGGSAGERTQVSIRGLNTFGDGSPLFVVDGVFVNDLTEINPASIEKVDVLKDAAASAIYGSRGSNGVVIITTKGGQSGKAKLSLDMNTGFQYIPESKFYDVINSDQLIDLLVTEDIRQPMPGSSINQGNDAPARLLDSNFVAANTNWQDEIYQNAPMTRVDLNVSGGSDFVKYNFGVGYFEQEGVQIDTDFKRYSLNLNTEYKLSNAIKIGQTLNTGFSDARVPETNGGQSLQEWAFRSLSYLPTRSPDGRLVSPSRTEDAISINALSPLLVTETQDNQRRRLNVLGSVYADVQLFRGLSNRIQLGANLSSTANDNQTNRVDETISIGDGQNPLKTVFKLRGQNLSTNLTNVLTYRKSFGGKHNFDASYIFERFSNTYEQVITRNRSLTEDNSITQFPNVSGDNVNIESIKLPELLFSHVGRLNYNYEGKYILSGSIRRDATSKFNDPVGIFPAGSIAWVVSREGFMENSKITNLKLRASYGVTGNNRVPVFANTAALNSSFGYVIGDQIVLGAAPDGISNTSLTWETSTKTNFGADIGLAKNRLKLSFDFFNSQSEDLIVIPPTDLSLGLARNPPVNSADINSWGYEITAGYGTSSGAFKWDVWGSFSVVRPEVKNVANGVDAIRNVQLNTGGNTDFANTVEVGQPLYGLFGYRTEGIFRTTEEVLTAPQQQQAYVQTSNGLVVTREMTDNGSFVFTNANGEVVNIDDVSLNTNVGTAPGDIRFADIDGNGVIDEADRTVIGDPNPDFTYSMNFNASYKGFDFNMFVSGVQGVDAYNHVRNPISTFFGGRNFSTDVLNRWTPTNTDTDIERYTSIDPNNNRRISDKGIEDASYLRIKNLAIGYTFGTDNMFKGSLSKLRVYVSAQNILTLTKYDGFDPEIRPVYGAGGIISGIGIDRGFSPLATSFLAGVQVGF